MTFDDRLAELLDAATAPMPPGRLAAPLPAIRRRIRRQRAVTALVVTGVVAALIAGFVLARPPVDRAAPPATPSPTASTLPDLRPQVAWETALLARDGRTVTVYTGSLSGCEDLVDATAVVTRQDGGQVTIAVRAWVAPTDECGVFASLRVELTGPLGDREVRDAASDEPRPTYRESHLPDLRNDARWRQFSAGSAGPGGLWHAGYNGPNGWTLQIEGEPGSTAGGDPADTLTLGSRQGTLVDLPATWAVRWSVGDLTYELSVRPSEGGVVTRQEFVAEVNRLAWP
jgi:hypothetical protein